MTHTFPLYLGSTPQTPNSDLSVSNKYTGEEAFRVSLANSAMIDQAIHMCVGAEPAMRALHPFQRQEILQFCVEQFQQRRDELAMTLCIEAGKPIHDSRGEVQRFIDTFRVAAEEAVRIDGEVLNLEISEHAQGYQGFTKRVPIGACSFISPFNFPLNLAAHKIAPAIACGCPFILKPASATPVSALLIGEILSQSSLPPGAFSILPCSRDGADLFTTDERLKLLSFTGSPEVGWKLKARAGKKRVVLELGGNAACIVDSDWDIEDAVQRIIVGAFYQSGQSCISVQRILIHSSCYPEFRSALVTAANALSSGDPTKESTFIGPMIAESEAVRLESWVNEAVVAGAKILCGGSRAGAMFEATLLENVSPDLKISREEAFGPVAILSPFDDFDAALHAVNDSRFGLQAGIFTRDLYKALRSWDTLEVGGVIIGDIPSWRVDNMPYGGVKDSGLGREGIRSAIAEMTEPRLLAVRTPPATNE